MIGGGIFVITGQAAAEHAGPAVLLAFILCAVGMYYLARQFSYFRDEDWALDMLSRAIDHGFFCHQAMVRDPWLDALRARAEFTELLRKARQLQLEASAAFLAGDGPGLLGLRAEGY